MSTATFDKRAVEGAARRALESRQYEEALVHLWRLADRQNITEDELKTAVKDMGTCYAALGRTRAAASARLYLGDRNGAFNVSSLPLDRARVQVDAKDHAGAAQSFEQAGWLGHAAIQCEVAKNDRGARVLWDRLASVPRLSEDLYASGLVHFNLGRACLRLGDRAAGRKAIVHAMHLLTAAADGFEAKGQRERAFDCYGVLLTIGKEGSFENLAEGYLNCIRILREDGLKYYVIQYYEDFQALAMQRNELHAAATLFREAADYSRRQALPYARHYRFKGAETSTLQGERILADGHADLVMSVSFSGDGRTLASGSYDRTIRLWDVATAKPYAVLPEQRDRVYAAQYAPDGHTLAGASGDGTVRFWEADPDRAAERICAAVSPRITPAEWSESFPDLDYAPPCP